MATRVEKFDEFHLDLMPTIERPPQTNQRMYQQACSNDAVTIESWRKQWIGHFKTNHEKFGPFKDRSLGQLHNIFYQRPCIVAGSGAALSRNVKELKERKDIPFISPLHNFAYLEDSGTPADYYVTLDSGKIVIPDMTEGARNGHDPQYYWDKSEEKTLLAYCATDPEVLERWKGKIYFFNSVVPAEDIVKAQDEVEPFKIIVSSGGNVTGASTYIAKVVFGCNPIIWVGCNYAFSYDRRFNPWKIDNFNMGNVIRCIDIYGNSVPSWQSYVNFKVFLEWLACTIPGIYINASEEGILGAYPEGNIKQIQQLPLKYTIDMYTMSKECIIRLPSGEMSSVDMEQVFKDPEYVIPGIGKPFCMY